MKSIIYIALLLSSYFCLAQDTSPKKYYLSNTKTLSNINVKASYAFESPDKKFICIADPDVSQVYLLKKGAKAKPKLIFNSPGCGYFPTWSDNSKSIFMKSKTKTGNEIKNEAVEYVLNSNKIVKRNDLDFRAIQSYSDAKSASSIVYINEKLQLVKANKQTNEITVLENKACYQPIVSPDKNKVAVHIGNEIWVYDLTQQLAPQKIGSGLVTSWSVDSELLLGFVDMSNDGHEISNSELYIYDVRNQSPHQLTDTKDMIEVNPTFSTDGNKIYYINYTDGSIIVSQFKSN